MSDPDDDDVYAPAPDHVALGRLVRVALRLPAVAVVQVAEAGPPPCPGLEDLPAPCLVLDYRAELGALDRR